MSLFINAITTVGQIQIDQLLRLEQFIITICRNLILLLLTPLFTISLLECVTYCYRLVLKSTKNTLEFAKFELTFKQLRSQTWRLHYEWLTRVLGRHDQVNPEQAKLTT